jgi:hypothetical protein
MARLARVELFAPDEIAIVHVMNRTVRRCFLMGSDPLTGKNFDHRKAWMEHELQRLARSFGIDLLCYAILSNHFHLVLRSRPDVVAQWDDSEVARRWLMLCPRRCDADRLPEEPNEFELNSIRNNPVKLKEIRSRLSDVSWWMRLLSQKIAQRANHDEKELGKFWQARYRAVRLLDETAILACAAYVDLNPIRAAMAESIETSEYTSAQQRALELRESLQSELPTRDSKRAIANIDSSYDSTATKTNATSKPISKSLCPLTLDELRGELGDCCHTSGHRSSDKGFLPISVGDYLSLLDWTARQIRSDKRGATPQNLKPIFDRLGINGEVWCELSRNFGRLFSTVAGKPKVIEETRSRSRHQRYKIRSRAKELLSTES